MPAKLRAKPGFRIVFPDELVLCPKHGCVMRVRNTRRGVVSFICPVLGCDAIEKKVENPTNDLVVRRAMSIVERVELRIRGLMEKGELDGHSTEGNANAD